jgi:hypothetical protein
MMEQMAGDANAVTEAERIMRRAITDDQNGMTDRERREAMRRMSQGAVSDAESRAMRAASQKKKGSPYIPNTNIPVGKVYSKEDMDRLERGYKKGGKVAKVMHEFGEGKLHSGSKKGPEVTNPKQAIAIALSEAGKSKKAKGGMAKHDDEAMDRKLIKSMVKPSVLKKAKGGACYSEGGFNNKRDYPLDIPSDEEMEKKAWAERKQQRKEAGDKTKKPVFAQGGMAQKVQMAKSNAIEASLKGQKKTAYADGGMAAAPQSPLQRMGLAPRAMGMGKAKGVPVAPRAPMIAPPSMGQRGVGVNAKRPGGPDVGAIRAAMSKAASVAAPDASPSMMKKGGKAKR